MFQQEELFYGRNVFERNPLGSNYKKTYDFTYTLIQLITYYKLMAREVDNFIKSKDELLIDQTKKWTIAFQALKEGIPI